jgi:hypothetical protein
VRYADVDTDRLEALRDGVFAFALTVLVLTIAVPPPGKYPRLLWRARQESDAGLQPTEFRSKAETSGLPRPRRTAHK